MYTGSSFWRDTMSPTKPGAAHTFGSLFLCVSKPGSVTILDFRPEERTGSLQLDTWGSRPNPILVGGTTIIDAFGPLQNHGFTERQADVTQTCAEAEDDVPDSSSRELAVQLSKLDGDDAWLRGLVVTYRQEGGSVGEVLVPWELGLCRQQSQEPFSDDRVC